MKIVKIGLTIVFMLLYNLFMLYTIHIAGIRKDIIAGVLFGIGMMFCNYCATAVFYGILKEGDK